LEVLHFNAAAINMKRVARKAANAEPSVVAPRAQQKAAKSLQPTDREAGSGENVENNILSYDVADDGSIIERTVERTLSLLDLRALYPSIRRQDAEQAIKRDAR